MGKLESGTIISAITRTLKDNFPNCTIYKDKKMQGLKKPCFFVFKLNSEQEKYNKYIFNRDLLINIRYMNEGNRSELEEVEFNLQMILNYIEKYDIKLVPRSIKSEIIDDVLQVFVSYSIRVMEIKEIEETMNSIESKGVIK
ncbi:phage tail terminator family protein [Clostridium baratii]|uniref:phage tail terminator family protein n=1 Tax=Clostridium baratii TaxID=1561 RepID=UPI0030D18A34